MIALLAVACVGRGPARTSWRGAQDPEVEYAAELRMLELFNRERQGSRLSPLSWHPRAALAARRDSLELHEMQTLTSRPASRVTVDNLLVPRSGTLVALRTVALARGFEDVLRRLMDNPNSRAILMASSATGVGIGIVVGDEVVSRRKVSITVLVSIRPSVAAVADAGTSPTR